jgi:predicted phosphodiesterase
LVCYGHTHVAAIEQRGPTLVVNPGALYRANPHSLAVIDLPELEALIINL